VARANLDALQQDGIVKRGEETGSMDADAEAVSARTTRPSAMPDNRLIRAASRRTRSARPNRASTARPVGWIISPKPSGRGASNRSNNTTRSPARARRRAVARPQTPHPAIATDRCPMFVELA
jgi:hypothetical protein